MKYLNEAYIRVSEIHISKYGSASFSYEIWPSKEESVTEEKPKKAKAKKDLQDKIDLLDIQLTMSGNAQQVALLQKQMDMELILPNMLVTKLDLMKQSVNIYKM